MSKSNNIRKRRRKSGYLSYLENIENLGNITDILNDDKSHIIEEQFKNKILNKLKDKQIYSILVMVKYVDEGVMKGSSPTVALHINKNINVFLLMDRIKTDLRHF
jgi:hypothetical protein